MLKDQQICHQPLYPFHLAFPVNSLSSARQFYGKVLGCVEGRSSHEWVDFNLYGHQIVAHKVNTQSDLDELCSDVDGHQVPVRHFGLVLPHDEWLALSKRLEAMRVAFLIKPSLRFKNTPGEQWTLFLKDRKVKILFSLNPYVYRSLTYQNGSKVHPCYFNRY